MLRCSNDAAARTFTEFTARRRPLPRSKDITTADTVADAENGFAALEAKVEEMQVEAAIEAELLAADAAAASPISLEGISHASADAPTVEAPPVLVAADVLRPATVGAPLGDASGALTATISTVHECAQATLHFQAETIASFARVRSPQDLLAAQVAYGERVLGLYTGALTRMAQALPRFARA